MQPKQLIEAFAARLEARDWDGLAALLDPEVVYELPQTGERIRGRDRYISFNAEYSGDWHVVPTLVLADEQAGCLLFEWREGDETQTAMAFFAHSGGLITKVTDFFPSPYDPPPGREHLVERDPRPGE